MLTGVVRRGWLMMILARCRILTGPRIGEVRGDEILLLSSNPGSP